MSREDQASVKKIEDNLRKTFPDNNFPDDKFVKICIEEAIAAAKEGNVGVGAILVNEKGEIVQRAHNQTFNPYYRSDLHAEMNVMTNFEEQFKHIESMYNFTLYTSLEPCPMCFTRLICSGIRKVFYAAEDNEGGMVQFQKNMPPIWQELSKKQEFQKARCSKELSEMALQVWLSTLEKANEKFLNRQKPH